MSENADKLCIDLCCGRKGFSRAFKEAGWELVTVDIDPKFEPTICADIRDLSVESIWRRVNNRQFSKVIVLASPPCERFSIANSHWPQKGIRKSLEIVGACIELIIDIKPDFWCIENPKARLRWFIGPPPNSVKLADYGYDVAVNGGRPKRPFKKTDLWTNIPFSLIDGEVIPKPKKGNWVDRSTLAEMPFGLSQAILEAVEQP